MKTQRNNRIPELDGLRVLMIFVVSWFHIWQQSWLTPRIGSYSLDYLVRSGYVWVDGTVLLSAFLLFLPYARSMYRGGTVPDTGDFYRRRAIRVLPSYYFILLTVFFAICLPWKLYYTPQFMVKDLATHFTFTFTFWYDTYIGTQLGAACWTLAIEVQAYLLFPLVAKGIMKKPFLTLSVLLVLCFGFRAWCIWSLTEYNTVVNQLINFLDVYVLGVLLAMVYVRLERVELKQIKGIVIRVLATVFFAGAMYALLRMLRLQASSSGYPAIQKNQMIYRPVFALCFGGLILSAPFSLKPLRLLLGNPVMKFLSGISMNYYLVHQTIIVHMKRLNIPYSESAMPQMDGNPEWQQRYTLLAFGISLLAAIAVTYLVEKPAAHLLQRRKTGS